MLSSAEIAFVAGVIDSRGHIRTEARRDRPEPRIRVTTRRIELLEYLADITGTKVHVDDRGYNRRPCSEHCRIKHEHRVRQSAAFNIDSTRATIVLYNIKPYVVSQVSEVRAALRTGLRWFPPPTGQAVEDMRKRGWEIPTGERQPRPLPPHGTAARYARGCHCTPCRAANAARARKARNQHKTKGR